MRAVILLLLAVAAVVLLVRCRQRGDAVVLLDRRTMRVVKQGSAGDMRRAAATLLRLERDFKAFLRSAAAAFPQDDAPSRILRRWNGKLYETREHAAITENKRRIRVCIRDARNRLLKYDLAKFVILHELAHVANDSWGHDKCFWTTFKVLLEMAVGLGFVEADIPRTTTYCGSEIGSDPSACVRTRTCKSSIGRGCDA